MTDGATWRTPSRTGEFDAVIEEIRKVPGYENFFASPTFDDVAPGGNGGPNGIAGRRRTGRVGTDCLGHQRHPRTAQST
jgi:hypothetical protein